MKISNKIYSISPQTQTTLTLSVCEETISSVISLIIIINRLHGIVLYRTVNHRVVIHKARYFCWSLLFLLHAIAAGKYTDHCQWISCSTDTLISTLISTRFTLVCNVIDIKARHIFYTYVHYRMLCLHSCIVLYLVIAWNFIVQFVMDIFY